MLNSKERFSDRVEDYSKYRPHYPTEILMTLKKHYHLNPKHQIADVGSGTGISTEMFLKNGNCVFAVEPNEKMRLQAEKDLKNYPGFTSINGSSEQTSLTENSADFIISAQAFHWFEPKATKIEFHRILKDQGCVIILFNDRKTVGTEFLVHYEELLKEFSTDYQNVNHRNIDHNKLKDFLGDYQEYHFPNHQDFDLTGLVGRLKSSSYVPKEGHPRFADMLKQIQSIFEQTQKKGLVRMEYQTQMFCTVWKKDS